MNINSINQKLSVQGSRENEIRKTQSAEIGKKDINIGINESSATSSEEVKSSGICCTVVETDVTSLSDVLGQDNQAFTGNEDALEYTVNHMTEEDYDELSDEGYSMEKYEAGRLERALERRKENYEFLEDTIDTRIENKEEFREDVERIAINNKYSDPMAKKIAQKLSESNLPVTDANVEAMMNAMNLSGVMTQLSENGMAALIGKEEPITLENIYHSQYSSIKVQSPGEEAWKSVSGQAKEILVAAGMEGTEADMEKAKWLFDHNLPISEDTFDTYNSLLELRNGVDEDMLLGKMAEAMKHGMAPEQADLNIVLSEKIEQAVGDFAAITEEAAAKVTEEGKKLNLVNLKYAKQEITEQQKNTAAENTSAGMDTAGKVLTQEILAGASENGKNSSEITAYRQLEEIRLKLTLESAHTLARKGIRVDTSELQRIVEGLKEIEKQYYENLLEEGNAEKTEANISILKAATETVASVRTVPAAVLGSTLKAGTAQTIDSLYQAGTELKASYDKAGAAYETLMTAPRKDMGDSIQKAFRNVDAILDGLNMEVTADNQRAVRILGYNRMEINENSITAVKAYDSQVTSLIDELHPAATVELIKRGINPLDMPMEQLIDEVRQIKDELGVSDEEKYSTFLWKLEKQNGISEEERKSYIGIYRLLNNVEKTDGAAIGSVLDTGKELTMNNLLTAVRTMKHKGVNVEVNDAFGALESLTFSRETITDQIKAGLGENNSTADNGSANSQEAKQAAALDEEVQFRQNQMTYQENILNEILEEITPDKLAQVAGGNENADGKMAAGNLEGLMNMTLEQLKEELSNTVEDADVHQEYLKETVENIRNTVADSSEPMEYLEQFNQPVSIENLAAASEYFTGSKNVFKELQKHADNLTEHMTSEQKEALTEAMEALTDSIDDAEVLWQKYDELEEKADEILNKEYENTAITSEDLKNLRLLGNGIALTGSMSRQEHYEIPVITGDTVTNVSLTIRKGTGEKGKLQISMNSEKFGRIEIEASIKEQAINGVILCESKEGLNKLNDCKEQMKAELEEMGLTVKQLSAAISDKALGRLGSSEDAGENHTETKVLYKAAKVFVEQLKAAETE